MQVKLKTKTFDLVDGGVRQTNKSDGANVLGLVLTNVESLDEVVDEATGCEKVEVIDNEIVVQTFENYINFQSISQNADIVEVTMFQPNTLQKLAQLQAVVAEQAETIDAQNAKIAEQDGTIAAQAGQISELEASQASQDTDIEGLGDAIIEMSEIVYK